jgi:hypothetical protein
MELRRPARVRSAQPTARRHRKGALAEPRGRLIERPDQVEHHRWLPPPDDERRRGLAEIDGPTRAMLHALHWRKPPRDARRLWVALAIALLLHAFFVAAVWYEMKPPAPASRVLEVQFDQGIRVRFITRAPARPAAPPALAPPPLRAVSEPAARSAPAEQVAAPTSGPVPPATKLFDRNGEAVLPAAAASVPATDYVERAPQGDTQIMQQRDLIKYKPTRFDPYWRKSSNAIDDALQKAVEKTMLKKTIRLPGGVRFHCAIALAALAGGCGGDPPPPPPPNDGDERMNMAPAPLVKGTPMPKPDVATCIAEYRAGKPLPYGCPVDTPARAVDAEHGKTGR